MKLKFDSSHSFIQLFNVSIINFILNLLNNYIILPFLNRTETDQMKQELPENHDKASDELLLEDT